MYKPIDEIDAYKADQAHRWLASIRQQRIKVQLLHDEIEQLRYKRDGIKAIDYSRTPAGQGQTLEDIIELIDNTLDEYISEMGILIKAQQQAVQRIGELESSLHQSLLMAHYISGHTWTDIERDMHYSKRAVSYNKTLALIAAYEVMPLEYRDKVHKAI